jgi:bifunctional DNase/RNase
MDTMLEAEIWTVSRLEGGGQILLRPKGGGPVLPLFVDDRELEAVDGGMDGPAPARPGVHDLFADFIAQSGFALLRVELYGLKNGLFRARLVFAGGSRPDPPVLEAAPGDALALALRLGRPVTVSRALAEKAGLPEDAALEGLGRENLIL